MSDTGYMTDVRPPSSGPSPAGAPSAGAPAAATSQPAPAGDWDWPALKALGRRWLSPVLEAEGWLALAYLLVGMLAGFGFFAAAVAAASVSFALAFVVVGFFLVVPAFRLVGAFAAAERGMARWIGAEFALRAPQPLAGVGPRAIRTALRDPVRWRQVGFVAANVVMAPLLYSVGALPYAVVAQLVFGANILPFNDLNVGTGGSLVLALPLAVVVLGAGPRVAVWVAARKAQVDAWFLGPDRLAEAERRVVTLADSRQDIFDAIISERRRIERNLHDGVQQQLVAIGLDLGMALGHVDDDPARTRELIELARSKVQGSIGELRQLGRGLHPAILADRGLDAALSAVVADAPLPISVHVDAGLGLSTDVAEVCYFVANEAIANVFKHAKARVASIHVTAVGDRVRVTVHDDGVGGADPTRGTGLAGIRARVHAVDGTLTVTSPPGGPTTLVAEMRRG